MLRDALAKADAAPRFAPPTPLAPEIARRLVERFGESVEPRRSLSAREALLRRLRLAGYDWDRVSPADRLDVALVLWDSATPPAEHERFLARFLDWVAIPWRRLQAARLATGWAHAFDPNLASIRTVAAFLAEHLDQLPEPWPSLAAEFPIFSVDSAPAALADAFLASGDSAAKFIGRHRIPDAGASGLILEVLGVAAERLRPRLASEPHLAARLSDLAVCEVRFRPDLAARGGRRRGGEVRRAVVEALLLPWHKSDPASPIKAAITAFLLRHCCDARVERKSWGEIAAPATQRMQRWLTEATVVTYFRLAGQRRRIDRTQLAQREAFWMGRLDQLDHAWLACGPRGAAALGPDQPARGILTACPADQVVLLMRVGGITIIESSHAESENAWAPTNPFAPSLYRGKDRPYSAASLANGADFSSSFGLKTTWQAALLEFIERHGGKQDSR